MAVTRRYIHPQAETIREGMEKARGAKSGHTFGHTGEIASPQPSTGSAVVN